MIIDFQKNQSISIPLHIISSYQHFMRIINKVIKTKIRNGSDRSVSSNLSIKQKHQQALFQTILLITLFTKTILSEVINQCPTKMSPTIKRIPNQKLYVSEPDPMWFGNKGNPERDPNWTNTNWLKSRFHFSFAEYDNYKNSNFGVIRVMNDDLVQPNRGFGTHPHHNMEIVTYVVDGELTHKDSMGTEETLGRGSIQFMTAGTGVRHSEHNLNKAKPLRFIQTWILPSQNNLKPNYGSCSGKLEKNKLTHLISNVKDTTTSTPVEINQDIDGYVGLLDYEQTITHPLPANRQAYLLCLEGSIKVNGVALEKYDASEIYGSNDNGEITIDATGTEETVDGDVAHFLLFTMAADPDGGRKDF